MNVNVSFKKLSDKEYILSTIFNGQELILSDSFEINDSEYVLLEILCSSENDEYLKILCIRGPGMGNRYLIPKHECEDTPVEYLSDILPSYQI